MSLPGNRLTEASKTKELIRKKESLRVSKRERKKGERLREKFNPTILNPKRISLSKQSKKMEIKLKYITWM